MTTPSIPDLIAALEEHDGAMTSGPWRPIIRAVTYGVLGKFRGETDCLVATRMTEECAAAIAWFGTHRGALAEALRMVARERDEARQDEASAAETLASLQAEIARLKSSGRLVQDLAIKRGNEFADALIETGKERDEAKREAESLRALLGEARQYIKTRRGCDVDLLARIDLARGKDVTR